MNTGVGEFDDEALRVLDEYLLSDTGPENGRGLSDLDGFLTALVVGTDLIQPSGWLPVVWGHKESAFESLDEAYAVLRPGLGLRRRSSARTASRRPWWGFPVQGRGMATTGLAAYGAAGGTFDWGYR